MFLKKVIWSLHFQICFAFASVIHFFKVSLNFEDGISVCSWKSRFCFGMEKVSWIYLFLFLSCSIEFILSAFIVFWFCFNLIDFWEQFFVYFRCGLVLNRCLVVQRLHVKRIKVFCADRRRWNNCLKKVNLPTCQRIEYENQLRLVKIVLDDIRKKRKLLRERKLSVLRNKIRLEVRFFNFFIDLEISFFKLFHLSNFDVFIFFCRDFSWSWESKSVFLLLILLKGLREMGSVEENFLNLKFL